MRWPFGPPHLTLKPSKKKQNKKKQNKKQHKKNKKKEKPRKEKKKTQKYQKKSFSVISQNFPFFDRVSKNCLFLTPWPRKRAPKNTIKIGVSACFFWKEVMRHETAIFGQKKTQIQKFQLSFFFLPFFSFKNKKHKNLLKPLFLLCFSKPKKREFSKN